MPGSWTRRFGGERAGLKIYKELGLSVRDAEGNLLHVDDRRLYPLWQAAGELNVPVMIHVADPHAFFLPLDANNERYAQLIRHPDWHFYGRDYPPLEQLLEERDHIVADHPRTTFIGAHVGSDADLDRASEALNGYANYVVDFSARVAELGRQPAAHGRTIDTRIAFYSERTGMTIRTCTAPIFSS